MMRAVLFSGPPHCGKDSIALAVKGIIQRALPGYPVGVEHPARVIRECGMILLGRVDSDELYEQLKAEPQPLFAPPFNPHRADTLREFMIRLLEDHLRPRYGVDFLSRITKARFAECWDDPNAILLLPSIGFQAESDFYVCDLGEENVLAVQVQRNGCSFESVNDSRSYVGAERNLAVENNATLDWAAQQVVAKMVNLGWNIQ